MTALFKDGRQGNKIARRTNAAAGADAVLSVDNLSLNMRKEKMNYYLNIFLLR